MNGNHTIIAAGNEEGQNGENNWLATVVDKIKSKAVVSQGNTMELSTDRLGTGGIHKFELLTREQLIATLPLSLERDSFYKNSPHDYKDIIKSRIEYNITHGKAAKFSLRNIENLIEECKNDYQRRIIFTDSIDNMISDMRSLGSKGKIHGNKKKYGTEIAKLTESDLTFDQEIINKFIALKGKAQNSKDMTKFKAEETYKGFTESYKTGLEKIVKNILNVRLESFTAKFSGLDIGVNEFMVLGDLLEHNKILQDGLNEVIDQVLHRLGNHIIEEIVKKNESSQADTITCEIKGILQKAFNKEKGWSSYGRRFLSPEEIKPSTGVYGAYINSGKAGGARPLA